MAGFHTFSRESAGLIAAVVRDYLRNNRITVDPQPADKPLARVNVRCGRTTTNDEFPDYPSAAAEPQAYVVRLGECCFGEEPGEQAPCITYYDPADYRVAYYPSSDYIPENSLVVLGLHHGRWYIVQVFTEQEAACPPCTGRGLWTWSSGNGYWSLTSDTCAADTDTNGCDCATADDADCNALYPDFCGINNNDTTYTNCSSCEALPTVDCQPTTCDCNTTTTLAPCSGNCTWNAVADQAYIDDVTGQVIVSYKWFLSTPCADTTCDCDTPGIAPTCNDSETTACGRDYASTGDGSGGLIGCSGKCYYVWNPNVDLWTLVKSDCTGSIGVGGPCICPGPTYSPTGSDCVLETTQCVSGDTTVPDCWHCYTTTTTAAPCGSRCIMRGDGAGGWNEASSDCDVSCPCADPGFASSSSAELAPSWCSATSTTTTCKPENEVCLLACVNGAWVELPYTTGTYSEYCCDDCCLPNTVNGCAGDPCVVPTGGLWGSCVGSSTTTAPPP